MVVEYDLIVILNLNFPVTPFYVLLAICVSYLMESLFKCFAHQKVFGYLCIFSFV